MTFEDTGKQKACGCYGEEASVIAHTAVRKQIAGIDDTAVVGD